MKKNIYQLMVITLSLLSVSLFAQHTKMYLPTWNDLSGTNCDKASQIENNQNFYFKSYPAYNGNRFKNDCSANEDQIFSNKGEYKFPSMLPLIVEVEVASGVNNVVWNITGVDAAIISAPEGSQFLDKNHVITPVSNGSMSVTVENPYRVKKNKTSVAYEHLSKTYYSDNIPFTRSNYYDKGRDEKTTECYLYNKNFKIGAKKSYIVILSTEEGYAHITATAKEKQADKRAIVIGRVHFISSDPFITCNESGSYSDFSLVVSGGPNESPIDLTTHTNNSYSINITNKGNNSIDLSQVILKIYPDDPQAGWWWVSDKPIFKRLSGTLEPKGHKSIDLKDEMFNVNVAKLPGNKGILKAKAVILYPTSPENGKQADLDLTYTYKEINKSYSLAGISTDLKYTLGGDYLLNIYNTAPASQSDAILFINSVKVGQSSVSFKDVNAGDAQSNSISKKGQISINYYLKYTEKNKNGNSVTKKLGSKVLNISQ